MKIRPIAIHLPQFHPIPENDEWWGKGFTEWTNVTKAKPRFEGHYQPHLPSDLGFYDLRLEEARLEQEKMAKEYGIFGFCYYHYWFNGELMLEKPLEEKLKNSKEDLPFMLCWANENWTRVWDGGENSMLRQQNYNFEDHLAHIRYLMPFFKDERYIRIHGKPVFALYRTAHIPDIEQVIDLWQNEAKKEGLELYIIRFESGGDMGEHFMTKNMDAAAEFQPHVGVHLRLRKEAYDIQELKKNFKTLKDEISLTTIKNSIRTRLFGKKQKIHKSREKTAEGKVIDYAEFINSDLELSRKTPKNYKHFPCVCPGFDNTARKSRNYLVLNNSTPDLFKFWTEEKLKDFRPFSEEENFFFLNAWNEWAEGNHLEPDRKWGKKYLEAVREIFS